MKRFLAILMIAALMLLPAVSIAQEETIAYGLGVIDNSETVMDGDTAVKGQLVIYTVKDGPIDKAGIKTGDIIVSIDGQPMNTGEDMDVFIANHHRGDTVTVRYLRAAEDSDEFFAEADYTAIETQLTFEPVVFFNPDVIDMEILERSPLYNVYEDGSWDLYPMWSMNIGDMQCLITMTYSDYYLDSQYEPDLTFYIFNAATEEWSEPIGFSAVLDETIYSFNALETWEMEEGKNASYVFCGEVARTFLNHLATAESIEFVFTASDQTITVPVFNSTLAALHEAAYVLEAAHVWDAYAELGSNDYYYEAKMVNPPVAEEETEQPEEIVEEPEEALPDPEKMIAVPLADTAEVGSLTVAVQQLEWAKQYAYNSHNQRLHFVAPENQKACLLSVDIKTEEGASGEKNRKKGDASPIALPQAYVLYDNEFYLGMTCTGTDSGTRTESDSAVPVDGSVKMQYVFILPEEAQSDNMQLFLIETLESLPNAETDKD